MCVDSSSSPTVIHVMPQGNGVRGVTSLGNDVFVIRHHSKKKIEVYTTPGPSHYSATSQFPGLVTACLV